MVIFLSYNITNLEFFWVILEINILSFIVLMWINGVFMERIIKYFVVQSYTSFLLFWIIFLQKLNYFFLDYFFFGIICLKLGFFPFHFWFLKILKYFNFCNIVYLVFFQKLVPFLFLWNLKILMNYENLIIFILGHCIFSSLKILNLNLIKEMIFFSSYLFFIMILLINFKVILLKIFFLYFIGFYYFIITLHFNNLDRFNGFFLKKFNIKNNFIFFLLILNLARIPPLWIFLLKIKLLVINFYANIVFILGVLVFRGVLSSFAYLSFILAFFLGALTFFKKKNYLIKKKPFSRRVLVLYYVFNIFILYV